MILMWRVVMSNIKCGYSEIVPVVLCPEQNGRPRYHFQIRPFSVYFGDMEASM